ncbi:carbonic anhydrase OS=Streptomyces microflavus OX=1919 GN=Smic_08090 PE=3 SV=1 [Streptomyces microflavus]
MFIACSDAHVVPALLTSSRPGDLYELRTYGGTLPHYAEHEPTSEAPDHGRGRRPVRHRHHRVRTLPVRGDGQALHPDSEAAPFQVAAGQWHTLMQFDALSEYPCVQARLIDRTLRLHAWYYDIDAGTTVRYDPRASAFLPL